MTAIVVNAAFGARFEGYLDTQQQARVEQVVASLTADYRTAGAWRADSLDRLGAGLVMSGSTVTVQGADGRFVWSLAESGVYPATTAMHREMMGVPDLGPAVTVPVVVEGRPVGTATVQVPQAVSPTADLEFRDAVNQLLLLAAAGAAAAALLLGLLVARRTTRPLAELTEATDDLAAGNRDRRARVSSDDEIGSWRGRSTPWPTRWTARTSYGRGSPPTSPTSSGPRWRSCRASSKRCRTASPIRTGG
ncbi:HAMP domain-containing protein [Pseudonocardia broussonetiae]|uniref:HAMP domain-containing protein n=1 Tax=Pseudonocardia broussonetiae TaxID=2736640 RepID=UPI001F0330DD|nr:HAMP domain-containing protein [Pseudonocardia broussonetiae]